MDNQMNDHTTSETPQTDEVDDRVSPDTNGHKDWKFSYFHTLAHAKKLGFI